MTIDFAGANIAQAANQDTITVAKGTAQLPPATENVLKGLNWGTPTEVAQAPEALPAPEFPVVNAAAAGNLVGAMNRALTACEKKFSADPKMSEEVAKMIDDAAAAVAHARGELKGADLIQVIKAFAYATKHETPEEKASPVLSRELQRSFFNTATWLTEHLEPKVKESNDPARLKSFQEAKRGLLRANMEFVGSQQPLDAQKEAKMFQALDAMLKEAGYKTPQELAASGQG